MSGRYSVDDLLKLQASPLVCKPAGLPPIEEWMGSQEPAAKRPTTRGRQEDGSLTESFSKRPPFDSSSRKLTSDPERIVLGPPRRSFASSNGRSVGKHGAHDSEDGGRERTNERNRAGEELESKGGDRRGLTGFTNKYISRHDQENNLHDRSRRRYDDEEMEGKGTREHERSKWNAREPREEQSLDDDVGEVNNTRSGYRRDQGRSKFDQPWFRSDKAGDEPKRETDRPSGWRNNKSRDGDWDLPGKTEVDPEWMDAMDNAEPQQAHTQEDFQRWKERMKAGSSSHEVKTEPSTQAHGVPSSKDDNSALGTNMFGLTSPDTSGNSMDKFFARFNEKKTGTDDKSNAKATTKTRFASLFSPQAEKPESLSTPVDAVMNTNVADLHVVPQESAAIQPMPTVDADQAGFQRILQMLGKREAAATPPSDGQKALPPGLSTGQSHQRHASPDLVALFKQDLPARQTPVPQPPTIPPGFGRLADSRSSTDKQIRQPNAPNKDELLLNLLRQAEISAKPQPQQSYHDHIGPPGNFGTSDQIRNGNRSASDVERPQMQERSSARSLFDDPAISSMSFSDEIRARESQRRTANGPPPGFDVPYGDSLRSNPSQQKPLHIMPPGLPRPPGFDQMPRMPPGWNGHQVTQAPAPPPQGRPGPPPGLASRGMPPFGSAPQPAMPQQQLPNQAQARPPAQRKYTGDSNMPSFPSGMPPPPSFMGHGPPPGFHHATAAQAAQNYGRFAMGGNDHSPPQQGLPPIPPPGMGRGFVDMYSGDRGGMRGGGGVPLPPGFR